MLDPLELIFFFLLGIDPRFFGREVSALNVWAVTLAFEYKFLKYNR